MTLSSGPSLSRARSKHSGYSLLELMIAVTILAILASLAVPAMRTMILDNRRAAAVNDLLTGFNLARAESARRGNTMSICASNANGTDCLDTQDGGRYVWSGGFLVFLNKGDEDFDVDTGEDDEVIRYLGLASDGALKITSTLQGFHLKPFNRPSTVGDIRFCDGRGANARLVIVTAQGRARSSEKTSDGSNISCP